MPTFGEELRRERELRAISLREVAEATKVNLRYLEAIERNQFDRLPGGVFNRGFVRAYAEFIGVDPEAMVNAYLLEEQSKAAPPPSVRDDVLRGDRERAGAKSRPAESDRRRAAPARPRAGDDAGPAEERPRPKRVRWGLVGLVVFVLVVAALVLYTVWGNGWPGSWGAGARG